jgi:hypothetical protein
MVGTDGAATPLGPHDGERTPQLFAMDRATVTDNARRYLRERFGHQSRRA